MRKNLNTRVRNWIVQILVIAGIGAGVWFSRDAWLPLVRESPGAETDEDRNGSHAEEPKVVRLSPQARSNLGLVSKSVSVQTYWRKIQIPGVIADQPGSSDRAITAPLEGIVEQVHAYEGDIVHPGGKLFTLRLIGEYLQKTQSDLYKATREIEILNREKMRINNLATSGAIPEKRLIELDQDISRQKVLVEASRQELITRGLNQAQIRQIEAGEFLRIVDVFAPEVSPAEPDAAVDSSAAADFFEVQNLGIELGQQVATGQLLAVLANHSSLYVRGNAFKKEASNLARAAEQGWPVEIEFTEDTARNWPELDQEFRIRNLANTTDPESRTFDFYIPLTNQSRIYENEGRRFISWRFRPGQRVRIQVPVEQLTNVLTVPSAAIAHEGPEAFVFQQNGDLFRRIPVRVVHQDRTHVVIANDGGLAPGFYIAQGSAASLNRILKSQASAGARNDVHVHADGTTHAAH